MAKKFRHEGRLVGLVEDFRYFSQFMVADARMSEMVRLFPAKSEYSLRGHGFKVKIEGRKGPFAALGTGPLPKLGR